jgi:hypothetical protein
VGKPKETQMAIAAALLRRVLRPPRPFSISQRGNAVFLSLLLLGRVCLSLNNSNMHAIESQSFLFITG